MSSKFPKDARPGAISRANQVANMSLEQAKQALLQSKKELDESLGQNFLDAFQPERGDLLYGLRDTRTEYLKVWQARLQKNDLNRLVAFLTLSSSGGKPNWNIIDNFNDYFF